MALRIHQAWLPVVGQQVEVRRDGKVVRAGTVDAVTPDDGTLWLAHDGVEPRRMFQRAEGFEVWLNYRWES